MHWFFISGKALHFINWSKAISWGTEFHFKFKQTLGYYRESATVFPGLHTWCIFLKSEKEKESPKLSNQGIQV